MEKAKLCVSIDWKVTSGLDNLKILQNLIKSFDNTHVDYIVLDPWASGIMNSQICDSLDDLCRERNISWIPLCTNIQSVNFTRPYYSKLPNGKSGYMLGIPSSHIKDFELMKYAKECSDYLILYTGQCTQKEIDRAIEACQPDIVIHHSKGDIRLDYIKYLQAISIEFDKKYQVGFKNNVYANTSLLIAAAMLDAKFLEFTIEASDANSEYYLGNAGVLYEYNQLVTDLDEISKSRGGYEARRLSKDEKIKNS